MRTKVREALDVVEEVLLEESTKGSGVPSKNATDLWNLLTALRGPDMHDFALKEDTTAKLRTIMFPRLARATSYLADFNGGQIPKQIFDMDRDELTSHYSATFGSHFHTHFYHALKAVKATDD